MNGISGNICFYRHAQVLLFNHCQTKWSGSNIPTVFDWMIATYPIQYVNYPTSLQMICLETYSPIECPYPFNTSTCVYGDLGERLGPITSTTTTQTFVDNVLDLYGPNSPIGRSIVLKRQNNNRIEFACANIDYQGISLTTLRAGYNDLVNGDAVLRRANGRSGTTLNVDLFTACNSTGVANDDGSPLNWYLRSGSCDNPGPVSKYMYMFLSHLSLIQTVQFSFSSLFWQIFGSDTHESEITMGAFDSCSRDNPRGCPPGDLTTKCGPIPGTLFESPNLYRYRAFCNDDQLGLLPVNSLTETVLVFEKANGRIVGCEELEHVNQLCARVDCIKRPRVGINILFYQRDPNDRTHVRSFVTGLDGEGAYLEIREFAAPNQTCSLAGGRFDKPRGPGTVITDSVITSMNGIPIPIGTLHTEITPITDRPSLVKQDATLWLPLFGQFSIIGRSIALVNNDGVTVTCCTIMEVTDPSLS